MGKKKLGPEFWAEWERQREEFRELMRRRAERLDAVAAHEAARQARMRRLTFGLLGRS
jgi:hypothetical protein